jgi:hypothetical protein
LAFTIASCNPIYNGEESANRIAAAAVDAVNVAIEGLRPKASWCPLEALEPMNIPESAAYLWSGASTEEAEERVVARGGIPLRSIM